MSRECRQNAYHFVRKRRAFMLLNRTCHLACPNHFLNILFGKTMEVHKSSKNVEVLTFIVAFCMAYMELHIMNAVHFK